MAARNFCSFESQTISFCFQRVLFRLWQFHSADQCLVAAIVEWCEYVANIHCMCSVTKSAFFVPWSFRLFFRLDLNSKNSRRLCLSNSLKNQFFQSDWYQVAIFELKYRWMEYISFFIFIWLPFCCSYLLSYHSPSSTSRTLSYSLPFDAAISSVSHNQRHSTYDRISEKTGHIIVQS